MLLNTLEIVWRFALGRMLESPEIGEIFDEDLIKIGWRLARVILEFYFYIEDYRNTGDLLDFSGCAKINTRKKVQFRMCLKINLHEKFRLNFLIFMRILTIFLYF